MASFNVKSLFANISLIETIGFCFENFYRNQTHDDSVLKIFLRRLLEMNKISLNKIITNNAMVLRWVLHWDPYWLISACATFEKSG